jgi:anti-sigma B factor antagonist
MNVKTWNEKDFFVVALEGRLDIGTAAQFEKDCLNWIEQGNRQFVLDLGNLEYISSAGLRSILAATKKLKPLGGSLSLCSLSGLVEEVITVSGFDNILSVYADMAQATGKGNR